MLQTRNSLVIVSPTIKVSRQEPGSLVSKKPGIFKDSISLASRKRLTNKIDPSKGLRHGTYLD